MVEDFNYFLSQPPPGTTASQADRVRGCPYVTFAAETCP